MTRAAWLLLLCACRPPGEPNPYVEPELSRPEIASFRWFCDADASRWRIEVEATSWTGGGTLYLTVDGDYVETHRVPSKSAAEDGSDDLLQTDLGISADFRDAGEGSTAFSCATNPHLQFRLLNPSGKAVDCLTRGPDPEIWATIDGVPVCDQAQ